MIETLETGRMIKALRALRGWTQKDLAKHSGLSHVTISSIERGHPVSRSSLLATAAALGIPLKTLIDSTASPDGEEATP